MHNLLTFICEDFPQALIFISEFVFDDVRHPLQLFSRFTLSI